MYACKQLPRLAGDILLDCCQLFLLLLLLLVLLLFLLYCCFTLLLFLMPAPSAGRISVTGISNVHVRFWSHEGWKSRLGWAYAELRPVLSPAQEQLEEERRRQWREWWTQRRHTARMTALLRRLPGAGSIGA